MVAGLLSHPKRQLYPPDKKMPVELTSTEQIFTETSRLVTQKSHIFMSENLNIMGQFVLKKSLSQFIQTIKACFELRVAKMEIGRNF